MTLLLAQQKLQQTAARLDLLPSGSGQMRAKKAAQMEMTVLLQVGPPALQVMLLPLPRPQKPAATTSPCGAGRL